MNGWWFFIEQKIKYLFLWGTTLLTGIWHILLGYYTADWDMTLLTGIWHNLLGYYTADWDMTLLTGIWHNLLGYYTGDWDKTLLTGIWHILLGYYTADWDMTYLLGYDTAYWNVSLLTGYWHLIIWENIVTSPSRVKMSSKNFDCWRWDHCALSKLWEPIIQWCSIPFQKNGYLTHTTVKSLKHAQNIQFIHLTMNCDVFWHYYKYQPFSDGGF
jgi:hypothetical protein